MSARDWWRKSPQSNWRSLKESWAQPKRPSRFAGWIGIIVKKLSAIGKRFRAPRYRAFNPALRIKPLKSFRLGKAPRRSASGLRSVNKTFNDGFVMFANNKWLFFKAALIHGLVYFFLVRAPEAISVGDINELLDGAADNDKHLVRRTYDLTITVLGLKATGIQQPLQAVIVWIVTSLGYIWIMREISARRDKADKRQILARDGFYRGQTGLASVALVILSGIIGLIPFAVGFWIYTTADNNVIFTNGFEQSLFIAIWVLLGLISLVAVARSAIAVYFATIPDVFPLEAHQMAGSVMRFRRILVVVKMISLLIILLIMMAIIVVGTISLIPRYAFVAVDVAMVLSVPIYHLMFYHLYLDLVRDHSS